VLRKPDEPSEAEDISHIFLHMPSTNHPIDAMVILVRAQVVLRMANESEFIARRDKMILANEQNANTTLQAG
jgi:hypothetical protein